VGDGAADDGRGVRHCVGILRQRDNARQTAGNRKLFPKLLGTCFSVVVALVGFGVAFAGRALRGKEKEKSKSVTGTWRRGVPGGGSLRALAKLGGEAGAELE
jgi:hypothetical protein